MRIKIAATATATIATALALPGQDWSEVAGATPPAVHSTQMVWDQDREVMVLFGGLPADDGVWPPPAPVAETWELANGVWTQRVTAHTPPARSQHAMCYSAGRDAVVLFGGIDSNGSPMNDVWFFDGVDWQTTYYSNGPIARAGATFVQGASTCFLVGGWSPVQGMLGDTWYLSSTGWHLHASTGPSPRRDAAGGRIWYDAPFGPDRWAVLLHGGTDGVTGLSDSWIFDNGWVPVPAAGGPARSGHAIVFDDPTDSLLLVGGRDANGSVPSIATTWRLGGQDWRELPTATRPPATIGAAVAMDPLRQRIVLAAGATDSQGSQLQSGQWEFEPGFLSEHFGSSCSYWPRTATLYGGICRRGESWQGRVSVNNPFNLSWSLFVFGFSNTTWNGVPLPMALGALGIPNCDLLVEPLVTQVAAIEPPGPFIQGGAPFSLPIPDLASAYGLDIYGQALVGNGSNVLVLSQGLRAQVW